MSGIAIYGSSCCMKSTITSKLHSMIPNSSLVSYSNGQIIDYYTDASAKCRPIDVLIGRALFYNGIGSCEMQYPILDRFLLDEYVWGLLNKSFTMKDLERFPIDAVYDWENDLINDMKLNRILLVNSDTDFIFNHCESRLDYFGLPKTKEGKLKYIELCDRFNQLFIQYTYDVKAVEIKSVIDEVLNSDSTVKLILSLVGV